MIVPQSWFSRLLSWLRSLWKEIPEPLKAQIVAVVVAAFEEVFRKYYQKSKSEQENKDA